MNSLRQIIGALPNDRSKLIGRMRFHQGWWRAFVLNLPQGPRPNDPNQLVCNTIDESASDSANFLTPRVAAAVEMALRGRNGDSGGIVDERRLRTNLLSSQPLAFNFFGHLSADLPLATRVLMPLFNINDADVVAIHFEYAPRRPIEDNSAFDVAIEYRRGPRRGLVGVECKYTDTFSPTEYTREAYLDLFHGAPATFLANYEELTSARFNQLFRSQLLAEGLRQRGDFDEVHVRLFCAPQDQKALSTGQEFAQMIGASDRTSFGVITYESFIATAQEQPLEWPDREWTMLLWARYCALSLSEEAYKEAVD